MENTSNSLKNSGVIDPETDPGVMYREIDEKKYKSEIELFDRWQSFSAEMLRLSLLGIAIFGFLFKEVFIRFNDPSNATLSIDGTIKLLSQSSVACFAFATVCALFYRYGSTEALMHFLKGLKNPPIEKLELRSRDRWLSSCLIFKVLGAVSLGLGAVFAAAAIFKLLK